MGWVAGVSGQPTDEALEMNGTSNVIRIQDNETISGPKDEFRLSFWIMNVTGATLSDGTYTILYKGKDEDTPTEDELEVRYKVKNGDEHPFLLRVKLNRHEVLFYKNGNPDLLPNNTWVKFDIQYNRFKDEGGSGGQLSVSYNTLGGQPVDLYIVDDDDNDKLPISMTLLDTMHPLRFLPEFHCYIDEIMMFDGE